jgi:diguanylate cyclase (GGDEF)-like protein
MRRLLAVLGALLGLVGVALAVLGVRSNVVDDGLVGALVAALGTAVVIVGMARAHLEHEGGAGVEQDQDRAAGSLTGQFDVIADHETGMLNAAFFAGLVPTKLATARRRLWPVSIVLMQVIAISEVVEEEAAPVMAAFAAVVLQTIRAADVACRVGPSTIALVLDDTDEDGAAWVAERVQIHTARLRDPRIVKVCCGIAAYPSHGVEAEELLETARAALASSVASSSGPGLGQVVVAPARPL